MTEETRPGFLANYKIVRPGPVDTSNRKYELNVWNQQRICNDFYGNRNWASRQLCPLLNLIQCALSITPPIEIIANSLQISNIELIMIPKYFYDTLVHNDTQVRLNFIICFSKVWFKSPFSRLYTNKRLFIKANDRALTNFFNKRLLRHTQILEFYTL